MAQSEVKIGDQRWMSSNLNVAAFRNGDPIPEAKTIEDWLEAGDKKQPAWCFYENDPSNGKKYGRIYNVFAILDPRGLAPKGWHIPTEEEWETLEEYLKGNINQQLKSTKGWSEELNGQNTYGFLALPSGRRKICGNFDDGGKRAQWWSSTTDDGISATSCALGQKNENRFQYSLSFDTDGLSVRCIKDK